MAAADSPPNTEHDTNDTPLPSWLADHLNIEWNSDDIDALLTSIDASQSSNKSALPHLPAELLLHILEYVPIDYLLNWRLVCRGLRDAIDGRILYHHLQRTRLVGYLGARKSNNMASLSDNAYEQLHMLQATFGFIENAHSDLHQNQRQCPIWSGTYALFNIDQRWGRMYQTCDSGEDFPSSTKMLSAVTLQRPDQGFGALTWAISLDTAVLDLDIPLEPSRRRFDVSVDPRAWTVRAEWRPMLFGFIKTETALRRCMSEKRESEFTFSHAEDCLRDVRRQRLHAALDPDDKIDRHIKWSLRLLRPLWGHSRNHDLTTLDFVEADAVGFLLLLRRTAALSQRQILHLHQLAADYKLMISTVNRLSRSMKDLQSQLIMPEHHAMMYMDTPRRHLRSHQIPKNPIAWSDELRATIEQRVQRWRAQKFLIEQMQALLITSRESLTVPEDAFDVMDSDF